MKHFPLFASGRYYSLLFTLLLHASFAASQTYEVTKAGITVQGIAREKPWSMTAEEAEGTSDLIFHNGKLAGVQLLKLSINVTDLKSKNTKMDQRAYKALKAYPYDRIHYLGKIMKVTEVGPNAYLLLAEGNLHIGGITQIVSLIVNINVNSDGSVSCTSTKEVKRRDFNIQLQPAEERVMRLSDSIQIDFQLTLTPITQSP